METVLIALVGATIAGVLGFSREQINASNEREKFWREASVPALERNTDALEKLQAKVELLDRSQNAAGS